MKDYGKAMDEIREVMERNEIKQFAIAMDDDVTSYSYNKSKVDEDSKFGKIISAMKN